MYFVIFVLRGVGKTLHFIHLQESPHIWTERKSKILETRHVTKPNLFITLMLTNNNMKSYTHWLESWGCETILLMNS